MAAPLLRRDGEVYCDAGLGLDGLTGLQIGTEAPLLDCFAGRRRKNRRSAEHMKILNVSISSNQCFENDSALHLHLLGQQRIVRLYRAGEKVSGAGREMNSRGGIRYAPGIPRPC